MTSFLFLQKFDDGVVVALPYAPLMAKLTRMGALGRGRGDLEIALPADAVAATCTVIGSAEAGITCIGFERPRFDDQLRDLVWGCMQEFGCAVFDDTLDTVYTTRKGDRDLPSSLRLACQPGARRVSSVQQLWPADFEIGQQGPARPALRYADPNPAGRGLQLFDHAGGNGSDLYIEIGMRAQACNAGTLQVLRNLQLRVDAAVCTNDAYSVVYRYSEHETSLLMLESAKIGELTSRSTVVSPAPCEQVKQDKFVADRGIFASEDVQTTQFIRRAREKYGSDIDPAAADITPLGALLDQAHAAYRKERERQGTGAPPSAAATAWARMAGAFLGHFIAQQIGAQWGYITRGQQRLLALRTHGGRICCPHHLVLDHVINGAADSVVDFIEALSGDAAANTPRSEDLVCQIPVLCEQLRGVRPLSDSADLPFAHLLARGALDFSILSLHHLDQYLSQLAPRLPELSDQALTDAILGAGAYLGEVIRSSAAEAGHWQWMTYNYAVQRDPGFAQSRPREMALLAVLDSADQMTYPFAHVAAILTGSATSTAHAYACRLSTASGAGEITVRQPGQKMHREEEVESALEQIERHAAWSAQMRRDEQVLDTPGVIVPLVMLMLIMLVLAYSVQSALTSFSAPAASLGPKMSLLYGAWIVGPSLFLAGYSFTISRRFLPLAAMLLGALMLASFGYTAYSVVLPPDPAPEDLTVFLWAPLAQFIWAGGWTLLLRRHVQDA